MEDNFDKDFDRLFARDLKAAGVNAQPDREEWGGLSARLDKAEWGWNWHRWLPWLLLPLLLLSNGWMMVQWRQLRQEISMVQSKAMEGVASMPSDPVRATAIIYDTVYRTVVVTRQVIETSMATKGVTPQQAADPTKPLPHPSDATQNQISKAKTARMDDPVLKKERQNLEKEAITGKVEATGLAEVHTPNKTPDTQNSTLDTLNTKHGSRNPKPEKQNTTPDTQNPTLDSLNTTPDTLNTTPETRHPTPDTTFDSLLAVSQLPAPIQRHRTPLHGRLGAGLGPALLVDAHDIQLSRSLVAQLQFEIGLGRHWAIVPACQYQTFGYETERGFDLRLGIEPPMPPGQEYKLRHVEGSAQAFIPSLSVQYRLRPDKKLSGYLSAGYALRLTQHGRTEYEFVHTGTGAEYQEERTARPLYRQHNAIVQAGLEYAILPRLSLWGGIQGLGNPRSRRSFSLAAGLLGVKYSVK